MKLYALSAILALFLFVQCSSSEKDKQSISSKVFADKVKLIDLDQKKICHNVVIEKDQMKEQIEKILVNK